MIVYKIINNIAPAYLSFVFMFQIAVVLDLLQIININWNRACQW